VRLASFYSLSLHFRRQNHIGVIMRAKHSPKQRQVLLHIFHQVYQPVDTRQQGISASLARRQAEYHLVKSAGRARFPERIGMNATFPITLDDMQVARAAYPTTVQGHGESDHIRRAIGMGDKEATEGLT
jgi:hypothetical protein